MTSEIPRAIDLKVGVHVGRHGSRSKTVVTIRPKHLRSEVVRPRGTVKEIGTPSLRLTFFCSAWISPPSERNATYYLRRPCLVRRVPLRLSSASVGTISSPFDLSVLSSLSCCFHFSTSSLVPALKPSDALDKPRRCASVRRVAVSDSAFHGTNPDSGSGMVRCIYSFSASKPETYHEPHPRSASCLPSFLVTAMLVLVRPVARKKLLIWLVTLLPSSATLTGHCLRYLASGARTRLLHNGRLLSEFWKSYTNSSTVRAASVQR